MWKPWDLHFLNCDSQIEVNICERSVVGTWNNNSFHVICQVRDNRKASDSSYYKTSHLKQNVSNLKKTKYK